MNYKCENCDHLADRDTFFDLSYRRPRFEVGDLYTDKECPECGGCAFPTDDPVVNLRYAAPELLAALQSCSKTLESLHKLYRIANATPGVDNSIPEVLSVEAEAKAAIAKATQPTND